MNRTKLLELYDDLHYAPLTKFGSNHRVYREILDRMSKEISELPKIPQKHKDFILETCVKNGIVLPKFLKGTWDQDLVDAHNNKPAESMQFTIRILVDQNKSVEQIRDYVIAVAEFNKKWG
jgi:hypothetical protein